MSSVTCIECKSEMPTGVDLCPECGFHFEDAPPIKCPECTNLVIFTGGVCPECGFPYEALDELMLEERFERGEPSPLGSQAEQLPMAAKHAAAASAAQVFDKVEVEAEAAPAVGIVAENHVCTLEELLSRLGSYLEEIRNGSGGGEFSSGMEKFLEQVELLKLETQNVLQGMQDIAGNFTSEMKGAVEGINSAKTSAVTDITAALSQGKSDIALTSSQIHQKVTSTVDYIFYISLAVVFFTALNIAVTMYVVKLVK